MRLLSIHPIPHLDAFVIRGNSTQTVSFEGFSDMNPFVLGFSVMILELVPWVLQIPPSFEGFCES